MAGNMDVSSLKGRIMKNLAKEMNDIDWGRVFYYDEDSPSKIRHVSTRNPRAIKDRQAGCLHKKTGYYRVGYDNRVFMVHRIVWMLFYGSLDSDEFIDHIDGDTTNNSIENLRKVTLKENSRNAKKRKSNSTGVTGVHYIEFPRKDRTVGYYVAQWFDDNRRHSKSFSTEKFGEELAFQKACTAREEAIKKVGNFTERHGT